MIGRWVCGTAMVVAGVVSASGCGESAWVQTRMQTSSEHTQQIQIVPNTDLDVLFVIDDSADMALAQARLVAARLTQRLDAFGCPLDYRIAFTTTDMGNPWCDPTTAEDGRFVASSCRGRLASDTSTGWAAKVDANAIACTDACRLDPDELDARMRPTTTHIDATARVRPWLENVDGQTNLPEDVSMLDAFACFAPQGVGGCGFESPLAAMEMALERARTPGAPEYGFLRPQAMLLVVMVTTETDCSVRDPAIFSPHGDRALWTDPELEHPTSGVCWKAGVRCSGGPGEYSGCEAVNRDASGAVIDDDDAAVLQPVERYVEVLQAIEDEKKRFNPDIEVVVSIVAGAPDGYSTGMRDIVYADAPDPGFQIEHGIGPGCSDQSDGLVGLPPVRLREFGEHFGDRNIHSVCDEDYTPALGGLLDRVDIALNRPSCFDACAADLDPDTDDLEPACIVAEERPGEAPEPVVACRRQGGAWVQPDGDSDICWAPLTDPTQTGLAVDDMSDECIDRGSNLEFVLLRRVGAPAVGGTTVRATCSVSSTPQLDCPALDW